ncbi:MAG: NAD kinase [Actinomycetales bacterium]
MSEPGRVLLVVNTRHASARELATRVATELNTRNLDVLLATDDWGAWDGEPRGFVQVPADEHAADGCELVVVLGGDGTILRGAERARASGVPILGVNLGHVGFLAEAEPEDVQAVVHAIVDRRWHVEERMALDVVIESPGAVAAQTWALNEISLEKQARERMIEVVVDVDGRPLSRWGCDGVVAATPTGSTAYAFSAGGPVVWPEVAALLLVPLSAHALFARPLVVGPGSVIGLELAGWSSAVLAADGRRLFDLMGGTRLQVRRSPDPVRLARLVEAPFTNRLVAKFDLPVDGWRGGGR